jgi:hypothetical protein
MEMNMPVRSLVRQASAMCFIVAACLLAVGCGGDGEGEYKAPDPNPPEVPEAAGHPTEGAHGGHLYDLGDHQFFAELVFDPETRKITIYTVQHDDIKQPAPMDADGAQLVLEAPGPGGEEQEVKLPLTARPQQGDPEGQASQFELAGDQLPAEFTGEEQLHGDLRFTHDGETFEAHLEPHEHDEHGHPVPHDHDEHDHDRPAGTPANR